MPPPPTRIYDRFTGAGVPRESISFARDTFTFEFPGSPAAFVSEFRRHYGPTMTAFEAAAKSGRAAQLEADLEALFVAQNRARRDDLTSIPATYLRVTVPL